MDSLGEPKDTHSVDTNPNLVNTSGTFSQPDDFKRTIYLVNGRGGVWPSVMGAYITGNEIIGPSKSRSKLDLEAQ